MKPNLAPLTQAILNGGITPRAASRLVRHRPSPMALEQRFMFDGAALTDATATLSDSNTSHTVDVLRLSDADTAPQALLTAEAEAERLLAEFLRQPDAQAQLFAIFSGNQTDSTPNADWLATFNQLIADASAGQLNVKVELRSQTELQGAKAAFSATGISGQPTIYLNADWLAGNGGEIAGADSASVAKVLIEEVGHYLDHVLNAGADTAGDEGDVFARVLVDGAHVATLAYLSDDGDHVTLQIDGHAVEAEMASFNFVNAYEMVYDQDNDTFGKTVDQITTGDIDTTERWADKEQNLHYFNATVSLGAVQVTDGTGNLNFSGNDVSATSILIGGVEYYGWISRPIKSGGVVRGFYFWTDASFTNFATAQADGNQDGDSSVLDNRGFLLVVDQAWFDSQISSTGTSKTINNTKDGNDGTITVANVGSSSDRVDSALNALVTSNAVPTATDDTTTGTPDAGVAGRPALEQGYGVATVNATGNVLTNDVDANGDTLTVSKITSTTTANSVSPTGSSSFTVAGKYGTLTIYADGRYSYEVNNNNSEVNALNVGDSLNDVFNYTANDGKGGTDTANLTIVIKGSNDAPFANPDYNIAKESTTVAGSGFNYTGYSATGNVLPNDTDVDDAYQSQSSDSTQPSGDFSIIGATVTGAITSSTISVTPGTYTLSFSLSNGFSSVGSGDEIYVHLGVKTPTNGDIYTGLYTFDSGTGAYTLIYVQTKNTTNGTITFNATPTHYWDTVTNTFKSVGGLNSFFTANPNLIFQNTTDNTPFVGETYTQANGDKYATTSAISGSGYTTISGLTAQVGSIAVGMTVSGTGVPTGTTVTGITVQDGVITSIKLSSDQVTSTSGTVFSFTGNSGVAQTLQGTHGTLTLNANGSYTYTPTTNNPYLSEGQSAVDAFNYTMQDSQGVQSNSTLYITVYGTGNNDPVANSDAADGTNGTTAAVEQGYNTNTSTQLTASVDASGNVLTNDLEKFGAANAGSDYVTLVSKNDGSGSTAVTTGGVNIVGTYGTLTIMADGSYTYAVNNTNSTVDALLPGESLTETFRYTVANTLTPSGTATARLTITINGANDAPVGNNDTGATLTEDADTAASGFVLLNDTDVDANDTKTVTKAGTSAANVAVNASSTSTSNGLAVDGIYGQLVIGADGSYTYTLGVTAGQINALQALTTSDHLTESFTYEITDTNGAADTATLSFTVNGANEPPVNSLPSSVTLQMDTPLAFTAGNTISVADADNNLSWVVLNVDHGTLDFTSAPSAETISGTGTGSVRIEGTRAEINAALALLRYSPTTSYTGFDYLTIMSQDGEFANDSDGIEIRIENNADTDGDGIVDSNDIDDDNDGILDFNETSSNFLWASFGDTEIVGNTLTSSIGTASFTFSAYTDNTKATTQAIQDVTVTQPGDFSGNTAGVSGSTSAVKNIDAGYREITFAQPILNPLFAFGSIGQPTVPVTINFNVAVEVVYANNCGGIVPGQLITSVTGNEGNLIVKLPGEQTTFGFTYVNSENWVGFSFGADIRLDIDTDGDSIVDRLDIDSDNDGITDNVEAQTTAGYIAPSAVWTDIDHDGLDDAYDSNTSSANATQSVGLNPVDTDGDGTKDYKDANSDGDTLNDIAERYDGAPKSVTSTTDTDGDGLLDIFEGSNANDGYVVNDGNYANGEFLLARISSVDADGSNATPLSEDMLYRSTAVPALSIGNATVEEGSNAVFTVSLNYVSQEPIEVEFTTSVTDPLSAEADDIDPLNLIVSYLGSGGTPITIDPTSGKYTIPAGVTTLTVKVPTTADDVYEGAETFTL
ncbi:S-layer family protein, partial [Aquabacterium sp. A08]|uniref:beta strand repeat-containing protein n=1 Tax=Aquabacterium sp. A08 TaxID=2718532 RepID=UPI001AAE8CCB